ncbi:MAG: cobalamin-dependent protein [Spirochaetales bacterium]|nr:cobalamin-dependent protein [Spirochaetales bacterium]
MNTERYRFRVIVPRFPNFNIYSAMASKTTSAGPVYVGTAASKMPLWDVEIIDENNCHGPLYPRNKNNQLDHEALQKQRPANVIGFYGSISSTVPRIYELAQIYHAQGVKTIAGGKHIENMPEEALANGIDVVVFGEGEITITEVLFAWQNKLPLESIKGISFNDEHGQINTPPRELIRDFNQAAFPDFNLLRYAKMDYYPINRTRGCNSHCEFCAVKDKARSCSAKRMFDNVVYLIETRGARHFFETSDHFAADRTSAIEFCQLIADYQKKHNIKLRFTVQTRVSDARYPELLQAMKNANIDMVCIGYESPLKDDLKTMKKGYSSAKLIEWSKIFHRYHFFIHGMFIFGYPAQKSEKARIDLKQHIKEYNRFIKNAKIDTLQLLLPIPLPGTALRERLEKEGRLFPLSEIGWEYYDGQFPLFQPDAGASAEDLQKSVKLIMKKFYSITNLGKIIFHILFTFPGLVFSTTLTLATGRAKLLIAAFNLWKRKFFRNNILKLGGYLIIKNWVKNFRKGTFLKKLNRVEQNARLYINVSEQNKTY